MLGTHTVDVYALRAHPMRAHLQNTTLLLVQVPLDVFKCSEQHLHNLEI